MRISSAAALALLAACSQAAEGPAAAAGDDDRIDCAPGGAATFGRDCLVERTTTAEGLVLTVRHPDGGFRRFLVTTSGIAAADGAERAMVSARENDSEVVVGADRYRFSAESLRDVRQ
jgi:hypothetical protein